MIEKSKWSYDVDYDEMMVIRENRDMQTETDLFSFEDMQTVKLILVWNETPFEWPSAYTNQQHTGLHTYILFNNLTGMIYGHHLSLILIFNCSSSRSQDIFCSKFRMMRMKRENKYWFFRNDDDYQPHFFWQYICTWC